MTDQRKALHDQVEETLEVDVDRLVEFVNRFLHPAESAGPETMVFERMPPGFAAAPEIERQRQEALANIRATQSEMIARVAGDAITRLGIDLNKIQTTAWGCSEQRGQTTSFECRWFEGPVSNCLSMFRLKEEKIVTFEQCHLSEGRSELIYKVRVLTPNAETEKKLTVAI